MNLLDSNSKTFWDHAHELRNVIIKSLMMIFLGVIVALFFYKEIFQIIEFPMSKKIQTSPFQSQSLNRKQIINNSENDALFSIPQNTLISYRSANTTAINNTTFNVQPGGYLVLDYLEEPKNFFIFGPTDGITTTFKVCLFIGTALTSPIWLYYILSFIAPALESKFYRLIIPFLFFSIFFMLLGSSFAFFITIPTANQYLLHFNQGIGVNFWSLSNYLDYTIVLIIGNALSFEMSVIAIFLVHYGVLSAKQLIQGRRYFIVGAFILSAILTPPDVLTQIMLAIPLIILYEFIILYANFFVEQRKTVAKPI